MLSSEIEGIEATLVDVLAWEQADQLGASSIEDIEEVTNYVAAVNHAFKEIHSPKGAPICVRLFNDGQGILMQGARGATKQPGNAVFVPPPPDRVADLLGELERYIHAEDDLAPLLRIALVHVQFETIHPYLDGNGRLGRMLIALLLDHWQLPKKPAALPEPLSQAEPGRLLPLAFRDSDRGRLAWLAAVLSDRRGRDR